MPPEINGSDAPIGSVPDRPGLVVVTQENFDAFVDQELGEPASAENEDPEAIAAAEAAEIEERQKAEAEKAAEPKEGDEKDGKVWFKGKWTGKHDFSYRLHVKTQEAEAAVAEKVAKSTAEAKAAREEAATAARERDELRLKYEPPKSQEIGPEPQPSQFTDIAEYGKALKEWAGDKAIKEAAAARSEQEAVKAREATVRAWNARQEAFVKEIPDYSEKLDESTVQVSDQMRDAIIESEVGPQILYHFAEHPEVAEALGKLTVRQMLVQFGKLEATLGSAGKQQGKSEGKATVAEVSKAPAPITPIRAANPGSGLKMDENGNWTGTADEYRAARLAGKIK